MASGANVLSRSLAILLGALGLLAAIAAETPARIHFIDVAARAGINAVIKNGDPERRWIPEANGTGAAWLDYDNDGLIDLLIVNGGSMELFRMAAHGQVPPPRNNGVYLYRNLGHGKFEDVTARAGLSNPWWGTGANAADFDNDGYTDILITTIGRDLLYRNNGNGTFTEVSQRAGLTQQMYWHTGSAFGDYDGDGKLDLYVAGYVALDAVPETTTAPTCNYRGVQSFCGPVGLKGEADILYHNNGDGTFTNVTDKAGVADKKFFHGFTVLFHDFNGDGRPDIFVANDSNPNYLYINQGDGTFRDEALPRGVAFNDDGNTMANMGVGLGDYDNDGLIDFVVTNFSQDYKPLFRQTKLGQYEDVSSRVGLSNIAFSWLGWACGLTDFDNDGYKDLWMANGHVYPGAGTIPMTTYLEPFAVFHNDKGTFTLEPAIIDRPPALSHRGACVGDFNNDGKPDVAVIPLDGSPLLLQNDTQTASNWTGFHLIGTHSNRDAIGASVRIEACGLTQVEEVSSGGSYLSRNDPRIHFGLGSCNVLTSTTIRWPSGKTQDVPGTQLNRYTTVREPR